MRRLHLLVVVVLSSPTLLCQVDPESVVIPPVFVDSASIVSPTIVAQTGGRVDTVSSEYHSSKLPGVALLFSALVPGAGQVYNESYWKVPIVLGFGIYFASQWLENNRQYRDYRDQFKASITPQTPSGNSQLLAIREFYKDQRDTFTWYFAILYFANLVDAYVDASLYDFDVGEDLSLRVMPQPGPRLSLQVNFR